MSGEVLPPDLDPLALRSSLSGLGPALDALRECVIRLGNAGGEAAPGRGRVEGAGGGNVPPLAAVQDVLSALSPDLVPAELNTLAMDMVCRVLGADRVMFFVAEPGAGRLRPRTAQGFRRDDMDTISVHPGEGIVGRAFKERRVLVSHGAGEAEDEDPFIERFPVREAIAVPVRAEEEVAGVLYAGRRGVGPSFTTNEVLLLLVIADRVGGGLVHQGLLDRRGERVARLKSLAEFGVENVVQGDPGPILVRACEVGARLVGVPAAALGLATVPGELEIRAVVGLPEGAEARRVDIREGLTGELFATGGPVCCRDLQWRQTTERSFLGDGGFRGCLLLPLQARGRTLGVLYLADTGVRDFSADEVEALRVLAAMTASAVEQSRLYRELSTAFEVARSSEERRREAERAWTLGGMAGGLAREFSSVFASILGKSQLLRSRVPDEPLRESLGALEEAAWRGADTVRRLAALAATIAEEGFASVDLAAVARDALALTRGCWRDAAEARGARIEVVTELESVPPVEANATALREAVMNLVLNAMDAMPNGGWLRVTTRSREGGVELSVADKGEGISDEVRRRIFDPFFTTRAPLRLGLGLTLVDAVVTRYRGRIDVTRGAEGGTTATIWLPAADTAADAAAPAGAPETVKTELPEAAAILVLEDEEQVRSLVIDALTRAGHKVETAADGLSGLQRLEGRRFDLVLTDLALPQRSGLAMARAVKRVSPRTPVVLITGWGHLLDPERLREHGVDLMLVKPFGPERLLSVVDTALRLRSSL